ncbi:MAG: LysM peptidoglycan-binding domain-containing protein [Planctomycetaceae bacterium]|nr:LysM peptidoglycan-binding domain-containing protein [Planctomycetaceae bacterium]
MHPDRKIGFAMGILLVGIVAALFFRNEPLMVSQVPTVRREQELNQQLKDRRAPVYTEYSHQQHSAEDHDAPWTLKDLYQDLHSRSDGVPVPVGSSLPAPRPQTPNPETQQPSREEFRSIADAPSDDATSRPLPPLPAPKTDEHEQAETRTTPSGPAAVEIPNPAGPPGSADAPKDAFASPDRFREYMVEYGDTLSEIAERFLGSQARYREIFEANRDRMSSPDQLRIGKAIRIPLH